MKTTKIDSFHGEYEFLSNFHMCSVLFEGAFYHSVEHAYQAGKTLDLAQRLVISQQLTAGDAKKEGRKVVLRDDWETAKFEVMHACVLDKFTRHEDLREKLLATGKAELVEGNWWGDCFFGVCKGVGENHLGRILMEVREQLKRKTNASKKTNKSGQKQPE